MLPSCGKRREREGGEENHKGIIIMEKSVVISPSMVAIDEKGSSLVNRGRAKLGRVESIQLERERRGKMTEKFSLLQSIVPNIFPKATRENIVTETIQYIHKLEEERDRLETLIKKSQESTAVMPTLTQCTNRREYSSSVNVVVSGNGVVFFGIRTAVNRRHSTVEIFGVFERHKAEVLAASISVNDGLDLTVTAFVGGNGDVIEKIKNELMKL